MEIEAGEFCFRAVYFDKQDELHVYQQTFYVKNSKDLKNRVTYVDEYIRLYFDVKGDIKITYRPIK